MAKPSLWGCRPEEAEASFGATLISNFLTSAMPELPEVETIVRELRAVILQRTIRRARLLRADLWATPPHSAAAFNRQFAGKRFTQINRRGKYLIFVLNDGQRLVGHLGMTGKFLVSRAADKAPDHLCSQYLFTDGLRLDHVDVRRFGSLGIYPPDAPIPAVKALGPEPLERNFNGATLRPLLYSRNGSRRKRAIHTLLLDQKLIAGVGNIYASEALFRSGIRPQKSAQKLRLADLPRLATCIKEVLRQSLKLGGTTISDYRRVDDKPGKFRALLQVYDRKGEPCRQCGALIRRVRLGGRSAFYCPKCQK